MKLTDELKLVIEMMLTRLEDRPGAMFAIPGDIVSPETVTAEEAEALALSGFKWIDEENYSGYMLNLNESYS